MKIKIGLFLPFQKLEQYDIETDLDDIIQALPNSDIDKQEVLDSILQYGHYDSFTCVDFAKKESLSPDEVASSPHLFGKEGEKLKAWMIDEHSLGEADGYTLSLRKNKSAETILTHPIYSPEEVIFLNNLNALKDDKFFHIKIHYYENVKLGEEHESVEKYSEIVVDGEEHQNTLLIGGPYDQSVRIANKEEIAKYEEALNANLIKQMKVKKYSVSKRDYVEELMPCSQYLIRLKDFNFEEWLNKLLLRRKEIAAQIQISDELVEIINLLKSTDDVSITLHSSEEWYGTYIDSEGDEEEEGDFTTEAEGVVDQDFLLMKLDDYVKERTEDKIRRWLELSSSRGLNSMRWERERDLDKEGDWLKDIIAIEKLELDNYDFAEWMEVSQCFDANPDIFHATDVEYSEPWNWDFDDREIEHADVFLTISTKNSSFDLSLY